MSRWKWAATSTGAPVTFLGQQMFRITFYVSYLFVLTRPSAAAASKTGLYRRPLSSLQADEIPRRETQPSL